MAVTCQQRHSFFECMGTASKWSEALTCIQFFRSTFSQWREGGREGRVAINQVHTAFNHQHFFCSSRLFSELGEKISFCNLTSHSRMCCCAFKQTSPEPDALVPPKYITSITRYGTAHFNQMGLFLDHLKLKRKVGPKN